MKKYSIVNIIRNTLADEAEILAGVKDKLNAEQLKDVTNVIMECKGKIITTGCGTSGVVGRKVAHTLSCIERPSLFMVPSDAAHGGLGVVQNQDVVIFFTKGGQTEELDVLIENCSLKKAITIVVTENPNSSIAKKSDYLLEVKVDREPDDFNMLATASIIATIAVFDSICITIARLKGFSKEEFAIIHPGGNVGKRLTQKD